MTGKSTRIRPRKKHPRVCAKCYTAFYGRMCPNCFYSEPLGEVPETVTELVEAQRVPKPSTDTPEATQLRTSNGMAGG